MTSDKYVLSWMRNKLKIILLIVTIPTVIWGSVAYSLYVVLKSEIPDFQDIIYAINNITNTSFFPIILFLFLGYLASIIICSAILIEKELWEEIREKFLEKK